MILSILENEKRERFAVPGSVLCYLGITVFCAVFYLIYNCFSHGVHSPYMTYLFAWPMVLGLLPCLVFWRLPRFRQPGNICINLYHPGVAAVTVSSLLRGIFEIAGTASVYQEWLMIAGGAFLLGGVCAYILGK